MTLVNELRRSRVAREAIEDAAPIFEGFDVAFVMHDLAGVDTADHAEDCGGCLMLADLAAELSTASLLAGGCLECGCSPSACGSAAGCGCTCCCSYLPAVTAQTAC